MKKLKEIRGMGITVYLEVTTIEALDILVKKLDRSRSWIVDRMIKERLGLTKEGGE